MTNQIPQSELLDLKKHILDCMTDYMPAFEDNDVRIPLNLTSCEAALKEHLAEVVLESAWEDPTDVVATVRWALHSLSNRGLVDMVIGDTPVPPDAQAHREWLQEFRAVFDISLVRLLVPEAKEDIPKVMRALRRAMLALAHLNLDAICEDAQRKAPGYRPYCYTEAEIAECDAVLTGYLEAVQAAPVRNDPAQIMAAVQRAVESLNDLHDRCGRSLIETDGREDICKLIQSAAESAGLRCADGEDITDEWRDW